MTNDVIIFKKADSIVCDDNMTEENYVNNNGKAIPIRFYVAQAKIC